MIRILTTSILLLVVNRGLSQCPESGLKIQSASCANPTELKVENVTCSELNVKWQGVHQQNYSVRVTSLDKLRGETTETEVIRVSCNASGRCAATILVKPGSTTKWTVQGICSNEANGLPGYVIEGGSVDIPFCNGLQISSRPELNVYPNPASNKLVVAYDGKVNDNTVFTVLSMNGNLIMQAKANTISRAGEGYQLNMQQLTGGTYLLRVSDGKELRQAKFIVIK